MMRPHSVLYKGNRQKPCMPEVSTAEATRDKSAEEHRSRVTCHRLQAKGAYAHKPYEIDGTKEYYGERARERVEKNEER